jgi:hypothetical protein
VLLQNQISGKDKPSIFSLTFCKNFSYFIIFSVSNWWKQY